MTGLELVDSLSAVVDAVDVVATGQAVLSDHLTVKEIVVTLATVRELSED